MVSKPPSRIRLSLVLVDGTSLYIRLVREQSRTIFILGGCNFGRPRTSPLERYGYFRNNLFWICCGIPKVKMLCYRCVPHSYKRSCCWCARNWFVTWPTHYRAGFSSGKYRHLEVLAYRVGGRFCVTSSVLVQFLSLVSGILSYIHAMQREFLWLCREALFTLQGSWFVLFTYANHHLAFPCLQISATKSIRLGKRQKANGCSTAA